MFWCGLLIGLFVGCTAGIVTVAIVTINKEDD